MGRFERFCWKVTFVAAAAAAVDLIYLIFFIEASEPQKAGAAAQVVAIVILPYVFTRAVQAWGHSERKIIARRKREFDAKWTAAGLVEAGRAEIEPSPAAAPKRSSTAEPEAAASVLRAALPMVAALAPTTRRGRGPWVILGLLLILVIIGLGNAYVRENIPALLLRWSIG